MEKCERCGKEAEVNDFGLCEDCNDAVTPEEEEMRNRARMGLTPDPDPTASQDFKNLPGKKPRPAR